MSQLNSLYNYISLCCILFIALNVQCQNVAEEIVKLNKAFYKSPNTAIEITTQIFVDDFSKPQKENKIKIYRLNSEYLYKTNDYESFANKTYKINVHHKKKIMIVSLITNQTPYSSDFKEFDTQNYKTALDTVLTFYKKVDLRQIDSKNNEITFYFKNGKYEFIKVTYDKKNYCIYDCYMKFSSQTVNQSKDGKQHQYAYKMLNKYINNNVAPKSIFNERDYFTIKNNKIIPVPTFQTYKLIDNTHTQ